MNPKKIIIISILLLVMFVVTGFFYFLKQSNNKTEPVAQKTDWSALAYSRVSFFNGSSVRGSLNMPEIWEGRYRMKEEGDTVTFSYLNQDGTAEKMFAIIKKNNSTESDKVVCEKNDKKLIFELFDYKNIENLSDLKEGLDFIPESIKCY